MSENGRKLLENTETQVNGKDLPLKTVLVNSQIVEKVIGILTHNRSIITDCFSGDTIFDRQLQLSFQDFLNLDVGKFSTAELLAFYCDKILKKGGIKGEKKQIEDELEHLS